MLGQKELALICAIVLPALVCALAWGHWWVEQARQRHGPYIRGEAPIDGFDDTTEDAE